MPSTMVSLLPDSAPDMPAALSLDWLRTDPSPPAPWDRDTFPRRLSAAPGIMAGPISGAVAAIAYPGPARFAVDSVYQLGTLARRELMERQVDGSYLFRDPFMFLADSWHSSAASTLTEWAYGRGAVGEWAKAADHAQQVRAAAKPSRTAVRHALDHANQLGDAARTEYGQVRAAVYAWGASAAEAIHTQRARTRPTRPAPRQMAVQLRPLTPNRKAR